MKTKPASKPSKKNLALVRALKHAECAQDTNGCFYQPEAALLRLIATMRRQGLV